MTVSNVIQLYLIKFGVKLLFPRFELLLFHRVVYFLQLLFYDSELVPQNGHSLKVVNIVHV